MDEGSDKNWLKLTDYPTQKVYYRLENGRSLYTFYCEKLIKAPIFNVLSVIAEAQTYKNWIPRLYKSDIVHEVSYFRKTGQFCVNMPWPWWNRSANIEVSAMP